MMQKRISVGSSDFLLDYRGIEKKLHFEKCFDFMLHIFTIVGDMSLVVLERVTSNGKRRPLNWH